MDFKNVSFVFAYKSRNAEYKRFPPKLVVNLPCFTPHEIYEEKISEQFGLLSAICTKTEEHGYTVHSLRADESSPLNRPFIDKPRNITEINTELRELSGVACLNNENILTIDEDDNIMRLYNLRGDLVKSVKTKSGNNPRNIAVTKKGHLV